MLHELPTDSYGRGGLTRAERERPSPTEAAEPLGAGALSRAAASARMRAAHQLQRCFDMSPGFGFLRLTLLLIAAGLLRGFDNGAVAVRLEQHSRVIVDFNLADPHAAVLLSVETGDSRHRVQ